MAQGVETERRHRGILLRSVEPELRWLDSERRALTILAHRVNPERRFRGNDASVSRYRAKVSACRGSVVRARAKGLASLSSVPRYRAQISNASCFGRSMSSAGPESSCHGHSIPDEGFRLLWLGDWTPTAGSEVSCFGRSIPSEGSHLPWLGDWTPTTSSEVSCFGRSTPSEGSARHDAGRSISSRG